MINVDFLFLLEHEDREMTSLKRFAHELKNLGFSSVILSTEFHAHHFRKYSPKNIVFPYAINENSWPIRYFLDDRYLKCNFISLNWEQLLSSANQKFKRPKTPLIQTNFHHLAWSEGFKDFLTASGVLPERVKVIGNPLHQLLLEDLLKASVHEDNLRASFSIPKNSNIYFFPMNYGWAFFDDKKIKKKIEMGYEEDVAWAYRDYSKKCLYSFISFISEVAAMYPEDTFVVRPHPSISVEQYESVFNHLKTVILNNIILTKRYTIKEWISVSKLVGSSWSTSVWDSVQVGKKGVLFTPYERPDWLETYWNSLVPNISTAEEFKLIAEGIDTLNISEIRVIESVVDWLSSISDDQEKRHPVAMGGSVRNHVLCSIYNTRAYFRELSMDKLGRFGVAEGLQRDYFNVLKYWVYK